MNKVFKIVWNQALQSWVVVSEFAKGKGKGKQRAVLSTALLGVLAAGYAQAYTNDHGVFNPTNTAHKTGATASIAIGASDNAQARVDSLNSTAIGNNVSINGNLSHNSIVVGFNSSISALGSTAIESSSDSIAIGSNTEIKGQKSVVIGYNSSVIATAANEASGVAIGDDADVTAKNSIAIGHWAKASDVDFNATALGLTAGTKSQGSALALGDQANATNNYAAAIGTRAIANGYASTALSYLSQALSYSAIALGQSTVAGTKTNDKAKSFGEIAIGYKANATGFHALSMGINSKSLGDRSVVIGEEAEATDKATQASALGYRAKVEKARALAVGNRANATDVDSTAIGTNSATIGQNSYAIGTTAKTNGRDSFAMGSRAVTDADTTIAFGTDSMANTKFGIAIGNLAQSGTSATVGYRSLAIGDKAKALANDSIAFGTEAFAADNTSMAIGRKAMNAGSASIAMGDTVLLSRDADRTVAIGREITATRADNVILGSRASEDSATINAGSYDTATGQLKVKVNSATVGSMNYAGFSGSRSVGVVSIGRDKADHENGDGGDGERRLINVGAGEISARSTDAINGSQLYAVANSIPATYTTTSGVPVVKIGDKFYNKGDVPTDGTAPDANKALKPADVMVSMISPDENKTVNAPTTLANVQGTLDGAVKQSDGTFNTAPTTNSTGTLPTGATLNNAATVGDVLNAGWNLKHSDGKNTTNKDFVRHADNVIFANGNGTIATVNTDGTNTTIKYDVNVDNSTIKVNAQGQLYAVSTGTNTSVLDSSTTKVTPDTTNAAAPTYKVEVNKATVAATPTDTAHATDITVDTKGKVVAPTTDANKNNHFVNADVLTKVVNASGFTLKTSETTGGSKLSGDDDIINPGETLDMTAGKNLTVKQEANGKVTYATKDDVNFNSVQFGENGPKINNSGGNINVGSSSGAPVKITGVKDGDISPESTQAVNGSQLYNLQQVVGGNTLNSMTTTPVQLNNGTTVHVVRSDEYTLKTYNVRDRTNYITNNMVEAIGRMNEEGIKFFHVNDEKVDKSKVQSGDNHVDSSAYGAYSAAIGYQAEANGDNSVALGKKAIADKDNAIAIGINAQANAKNTISIGNGNIVNGENSGAIGDPSKIDAANSYSVGNNNEIAAGQTDVFALGNEVKKTQSNSVFLGSKSGSFEQANAGTGRNGVHTKTATSNYTYKGENDANVAGVSDAVGVVSVGNATETRQIQGVAAGVVSATSTDAINGSQLYYTNKAIDKLGDVVNKNNRQLRAGIAGSNAAAGLPQVYLPGKSMVAASAGTFKGEGALAVGYSRASDNGKVILKLQGNANTRGDLGGSVGVGYQW